MHNQNWKVICVSLCLLAVMLACGSFSAPEDCGDNIGEQRMTLFLVDILKAWTLSMP